MAEIVLFHSILGLRPAVGEAADRLRAAGHTVHTPDLFGGRTFDEYDPAFAWVESSGVDQQLVDLTHAAVESLPAGLVYAGFSLGAFCAELLAGTRPGARGLVLLHGAISLSGIEAEAWPGNVPVQVHYALDDPYREQDELEAFEAAVHASGADYELYNYQIAGHLFTDRGLPEEYHEQSADQLYSRVLDFLGRIDKPQ
ncbi:MAG TPA: dienelactone hydrolase family protein [Actinocrinis sp.]|nr:dienelactone hydrolase family protein [Actinocrinis sp.]